MSDKLFKNDLTPFKEMRTLGRLRCLLLSFSPVPQCPPQLPGPRFW